LLNASKDATCGHWEEQTAARAAVPVLLAMTLMNSSKDPPGVGNMLPQSGTR
jgi:hypothetical protein